jgi:autotransporter passenger strand-loop-strand repeat protein
VNNGGLQFVEGVGAASGTTVSSGAIQTVSGIANGTTVNGGTENVYGTDSGAMINAGGTQYVYGSSLNVEVAKGGLQIVHGNAAGTTVDKGGVQDVIGTASNTKVSGMEAVFAGGLASGTTVAADGLETIASGGVAVDTTVAAGGDEVISLGGTATDTLLLSGGTIDVRFLGYASGGSAGLHSGTDLLTVSIGGQTYTQQLTGSYTGEAFHLAPDGSGGTDITLGAPCFCEGTRIATGRGPVPVEKLRPGDRVHAPLDGKLRPVIWVGRRSVDCRQHPHPAQVWPIRVSTGAFAPGRPGRDLCLSPDHAVFIDGMMIPVRCLVNGMTIVQEPRHSVTYWHVELSRHAVICAEGVAAESYLDTGNRSALYGPADHGRMIAPTSCLSGPSGDESLTHPAA